MDDEFAHARLFIKTDRRHAMSFALMSFLRRSELGLAQTSSAEGRLETSFVQRFSRARVAAASAQEATRADELLAKHERVVLWLSQIEEPAD